MPPILPICPYCKTNRLRRKDHKTCGAAACRSKRGRELAARNRHDAQKAGGADSLYTPEVRDVAMAAARGSKDLAAAATRDVVRELVRENMTDDIIESLQSILLLVPTAMQQLQADLNAPDPVTRQRAYELVLRYTLGNKAIAPKPQEETPSPMTVVLNVPASGADLSTNGPVPVDAESEEIRNCMECGEPKPDSEFVAGSDRCCACHDAVMEKIKARFGPQ